MSDHKHRAVIERAYITYPRPKYFAMLEADRHLKGLGTKPLRKSEICNDIIEHYYRSKPEAEQQKLINYYNERILKSAKKP